MVIRAKGTSRAVPRLLTLFSMIQEPKPIPPPVIDRDHQHSRHLWLISHVRAPLEPLFLCLIEDLLHILTAGQIAGNNPSRLSEARINITSHESNPRNSCMIGCGNVVFREILFGLRRTAPYIRQKESTVYCHLLLVLCLFDPSCVHWEKIQWKGGQCSPPITLRHSMCLEILI